LPPPAFIDATEISTHLARVDIVPERVRLENIMNKEQYSPSFAEETPTPAELRAIRRGEAAIKRRDYITLDELRRKEAVARGPRRTRAKIS